MRLTWLRILLLFPGILFLYAPMLFPYATAASLAIFLVCTVTDWLDGYLARKNNQITPLGSFLDPLADKMLVYAFLVVLTGFSIYPTLLLLLHLLRDLFHDALRSFVASRGTVIGANAMSKIKTILQMASIALGLLVLVRFEDGGVYDLISDQALLAANILLLVAFLFGLAGSMQFTVKVRRFLSSR